MFLVKWTWIDMIINSGGIVFSSVVFAILYFVCNSYFELSKNFFWLSKRFGSTVILISLLIIGATNGFESQRLLVTPAIVIRNGFFQKGISIAQMNVIMLLIIAVGIVLFFIIHSPSFANRENCYCQKNLTKLQKRIFTSTLIFGYLLMIIYTIQPTVRYLINGIFH
jgi:NADH:ubiquinone oxidoreductase subunit 6 (subunit J)